MILLTILVSLLETGKAVNNYEINIAVFLNEADIYQDIAFHSAETLFSNRTHPNRNVSSKRRPVSIRLTKHNISNATLSIDALGIEIPRIWNIASNSQGAIFLDNTRDSSLMSLLLEACHIPTIGLQQRPAGIPITQESSKSFTRVAAPSVIQYGVAMVTIIQKMGWRSFCLIVTADYEGKVFVDAMRQFSKRERWHLLKTLWIGDEAMETPNLKKILDLKPDVIVGHIRRNPIDDIFWIIQKLQSTEKSSAWLVTDVTTYRIRHIRSLPAGLIKVGLKTPEIGHDIKFYINALYDALLLFEAAFESYEESDGHYSTSARTNCPHEERRRQLQQTNIIGRSSLFKRHSVLDEALGIYNIWNLKRDLHGKKHWTLAGFGTPTGLALEPVLLQNGNVISPLRHPKLPVLRVPVVTWPPLVQLKDPIVGSNRKKSCVGKAIPCFKYLSVENSTRQVKQQFCCFGAAIDCLKFLQRDLGFEAEVYLTPDGQYGTFNVTSGTWNGVVNELVSGNGDLAIDLSLNVERAGAVDLLHPNIPLSLNILVTKKHSYSEKASSWFSWLAPFERGLWITILVTCNAILLVVWWLDRKSPKGYYHILKDSDEDAFTLLDSMCYIWGVAFGKDIGVEKTPRSNSARLVSVVYAFLALVMLNTYCANLMAFLLQENVDLPITGIKDAKLTDKSLSPPDGFRLGITRGTGEEAYFKNHIDAVFRKIYHVNLKIHLFDSFADGIRQLKDEKVDGFVADYLSLLQVGNGDCCCQYSLAGPNFFDFGYSFAFPKDSPWTEEANLSVLKNLENGSIQAIVDYWFDKKKCKAVLPKQLGFDKFFGLFLLLLCVMAFSFLALVSEMLIIFLLMKSGQHLGPIGRSLKRMIFSVRKGKENDVHITWSQLYKRHKRLTPRETKSVVFPVYNLSFDEFAEVTSHQFTLNGRNGGIDHMRVNGHVDGPYETDLSL